jgi:hypothetical protein
VRADLNKVMCESPRVGGDDFHEYRPRMKQFVDHYEDLDDDIILNGDSSGPRVGIRSSKVYWNGRKSFNEHLNPLRGIIRKNVGRRWDKVYSELCSVFDKRSVINQHILIHLFQYVETKNIYVRDGKLWFLENSSYRPSNGDGNFVPLRNSRVEWYVDPRNGILRENTNKISYRSQRKQAAASRLEAERDEKQTFPDGSSIFRDHKGIWFYCMEVKQTPVIVETQVYERASPGDPTSPMHLVTKKTPVYPELRNWRGEMVRGTIVQTQYKALNHAQLKHYGVQNRYDETQSGLSNAKLKKRIKICKTKQ